MQFHDRARRAWPAAAVVAAIVLTAAGPAAAAPGDGEIRHAGGPTAIPDSYIVVLKDGLIAKSDVRSRGQALARRYGGALGHVYTDALRGFSVKASEAQARRLAADPAVAYVEQDHRVDAQDVQPDPPSWGLDRIDQRNLPLDSSYTYRESGDVTVYVIDTGIRITHTDFGGRASHGFDFVDNDEVADDCHGHGTHVAGTVGGTAHGVAKQARLVAVRVLNCDGSGEWAGVIAGVDWVTANAQRPAVANVSLGAGGSLDAVEDAVRASIASGVTYAIAAGNAGISACDFTPARVAEAITVGATDAADVRPGFSNWGPCVDIFAPGMAITSAWTGSDTATNTISGTSMAAPHVAGVAALYLHQHPDASPFTVHNAVAKIGTPGKVGDPGPGSPNNLLYSQFSQRPATGDFDLDGASDHAVWRPGNGTWYLRDLGTVQWGLSGDVPVSADYDGDGDLDLAVWRPSNGTWYVRNISSTQWGMVGDVPVPGDYDGDGDLDLAVWRPSNGTWYVRNISSTQWGMVGDVPVPGDHNGDGTTDVAVWRPGNGTWYVRNISSTQWGMAGDVPVLADYDQNGSLDIAVWRPGNGTWYVRNIASTQWGLNGDVPVPGDYNGDGSFDLTVWRPSNGTWYVRNVSATQWGLAGDVPAP